MQALAQPLPLHSSLVFKSPKAPYLEWNQFYIHVRMNKVLFLFYVLGLYFPDMVMYYGRTEKKAE